MNWNLTAHIIWKLGFVHDVTKLIHWREHVKIWSKLYHRLKLRVGDNEALFLTLSGRLHEYRGKGIKLKSEKDRLELRADVNKLQEEINELVREEFGVDNLPKDVCREFGLRIVYPLNIADKVVSMLETPALEASVKVPYRYFVPLLVVEGFKVFEARNIVDKIVNFVSSTTQDIIRGLYVGEGETVTEVLELMARYPKETREPYCDTSLLTHCWSVATLSRVLSRAIDYILQEPRKLQELRLRLSCISLDFYEYLSSSARLLHARIKQHAIGKLIESIRRKLCDNKFIDLAISFVTTLVSWPLYTTRKLTKVPVTPVLAYFIELHDENYSNKFVKLVYEIIEREVPELEGCILIRRGVREVPLSERISLEEEKRMLDQ